MIKIKKLEKSFNGNILFAIDDLKLEDGIYQLKGANGFGKTTFLDILANLNQTYQGQMANEHKNILYLSHQAVGMKPFTIRENIDMLYRAFGLRTKAYENDLKKLFGNNLSIPYQQASVGTQMKVGLSLLLASKWEVVLLDETLATIDAKSRQMLVEKIIQLSKQAIVVYVSHSSISREIENIQSDLTIDKGHIYEIQV